MAISLGTLYGARCWRACSISSSPVAVWPDLITTAAVTTSIQRVGEAEHGRLGDGRMLIQSLFDFLTGHVLAAGLDHVLFAVNDAEIAVLVHDPEVA